MTASGAAALAVLLALSWVAATPARAAAPPVILETWSHTVFATSARLGAKIDPEEAATGYHFEYIARQGYDANIAAGRDPFTGSLRVPVFSDASAGAGADPVVVGPQFIFTLAPSTTYYFRVAAKHSGESYVYGPTKFFITQPISTVPDSCANKPVRDQQASNYLPDCRAFEMISPVDKNGGEVAAASSSGRGGLAQAAESGASVTYGTETSFADGAGAPTISQYQATRVASGWSTENISPPLISGSYDFAMGAPFQAFSSSLERSIFLSGDHCRGDSDGCPVANPPLPGTQAPVGYQNFYVRTDASGQVQAMIGAGQLTFSNVEPRAFEVSLVGVTPDLTGAVLSSCAALTVDAIEVQSGDGCDVAKQNLYLHTSAGGFALINVKPGDTVGEPGAWLAAANGAVSSTGSRIYWHDAGNDLYLWSGASSVLLAEGAQFQTASADGSVAFYLKNGHLYRFAAPSFTTDLTPTGQVEGVFGASSSGGTVYFQQNGQIKRWSAGSTSLVADGKALDESFPPALGRARVAPDGADLLFLSAAKLTGYDNNSASSGTPLSEVYLYKQGAGGGVLRCVSCNSTNGRPIGGSTISGAVPNGSQGLRSYKPRNLSSSGHRVFFESNDSLVPGDTNAGTDVYQWEGQGEGGCGTSGGCINLISDGRTASGATFADASASGGAAFIITKASLIATDPGAADLYSVLVGGGFFIAQPPTPCVADACRILPPEPVDPTLTTLQSGAGNPPVSYPRARKKCPKGKVRRKTKCVKRGHKGAHRKQNHHRSGAKRQKGDGS